MSTDAKRAGNLRHQSKLDRIVIQPYKEDGQRIRNAASEAGQSVQAYILEAVFYRIGQSESAPQRPTRADQARPQAEPPEPPAPPESAPQATPPTDAPTVPPLSSRRAARSAALRSFTTNTTNTPNNIT